MTRLEIESTRGSRKVAISGLVDMLLTIASGRQTNGENVHVAAPDVFWLYPTKPRRVILDLV